MRAVSLFLSGAEVSELIPVCYVVVLAPLDPVKLVSYIMEKTEKTARCAFRFVQRLTPITKAFTGNKSTLAEMAAEVLPPAFKTEDNRGLKVGRSPITSS